MELEYTRLPTPDFFLKQGQTYETLYIYTGYGKYDTERKVLMTMERLPNGNLRMKEAVYDPKVISRAFHSEMVRVTVYSENPRMWKEEISPVEIYFFKQVKQDLIA